jgi:6,7-dimethyl-8-ribityllumazine synthase
MATQHKNLSQYSDKNLVSIAEHKFAIVVAEWHHAITDALLQAAVETLKYHGAVSSHIKVVYVPGSFELSLGAQKLAQKKKYDAVICLGCIIQGETKHFDFIAQAVAHGITNVSLKYDKPVIFGVLTTDTLEQAQDRAGGKHGNNGEEAAISAIKMLAL